MKKNLSKTQWLQRWTILGKADVYIKYLSSLYNEGCVRTGKGLYYITKHKNLRSWSLLAPHPEILQVDLGGKFSVVDGRQIGWT